MTEINTKKDMLMGKKKLLFMQDGLSIEMMVIVDVATVTHIMKIMAKQYRIIGITAHIAGLKWIKQAISQQALHI